MLLPSTSIARTIFVFGKSDRASVTSAGDGSANYRA